MMRGDAIWGLAACGGSKAHLAASGTYSEGFESYCGTKITVQWQRGGTPPAYPAGAEKCGSCQRIVAKLAAAAAEPAPEYVTETLVVTVTRPAKHQSLSALIGHALERRTGWDWSVTEITADELDSLLAVVRKAASE